MENLEKNFKKSLLILLYLSIVFLIFHFSRNLEILKTNGIDKWMESIELSIKKSPFSTEGMTYPNFKIFVATSFVNRNDINIFYE
jgi:hypothetical protein